MGIHSFFYLRQNLRRIDGRIVCLFSHFVNIPLLFFSHFYCTFFVLDGYCLRFMKANGTELYLSVP